MQKTETGGIEVQNKNAKRDTIAKAVSERRYINHRHELKRGMKDLDNFGKFIFELDVLTIAGAYECFTRNCRFSYLKDFVIQNSSYKDKIGSREKNLIFNYLDHDNMGFKLMINMGLQNVVSNKYLRGAFAKCYVALYFAERFDKGQAGDIHGDIKNGFLSLFEQTDSYALDDINRVIYRYKEGFDVPKDLCKIAGCYRNEILDVYQKIYDELKKRGVFCSTGEEKQPNAQLNAGSSEDDKVEADRAGDEEINVLQKKLEDYQLMIGVLESQIEELREYNSELQKELEILLEERRSLPEKVIVKLFNDLNSEQFGNLLDRIYLYAKGLEQVELDAVQEIFTNIIAVLSLYKIQAHLLENEYKNAITVKKEEIGTEYRCNRLQLDDRDTYEAEVVYPEWTYGHKRIACKFIKIK